MKEEQEENRRREQALLKIPMELRLDLNQSPKV